MHWILLLVAVVGPPAVVTLGARRSNTATAEKTLELNWWQDRVNNRFNPLPTVPKVGGRKAQEGKLALL